MGILRADILTHSQLESAGGSVDFDGSGDYLTIPNHTAFHFTGDYTIDFYIKFSTNSGTQRIFGQRNSNASDISVLGEFASNNFYYYYSTNGSSTENMIIGTYGTNIELNTWHHVAIVSDGGVHHAYLDGVQTAVNANNSPPLNDGDSTWSIGRQGAYTANEFSGSIYGFRITNKALYKTNFTLSKFKPKVLPETILLCCVSSTSVTEAEVSAAGDITSNGDPQVSTDTPLLKEDITDTGVVFDGFGNFATSTYMVPPSGKTTERNRGRGVLAGGYVHPNLGHNSMMYIEIQTQGNAQDFGDLGTARSYFPAGQTSSSTRGLSSAGWNNGGINTIEFITIANTSNATDFGDTSIARMSGALSNQTRAVHAGTTSPFSNVIDFVTIATTGDAQNFGDLVEPQSLFAGASSSTRGVFGGGRNNTPSENTLHNTMQFITIATTGDAQDFGDLQALRYGHTGFSSPTRGIFAGGYLTPGQTASIDFFTIATLGNSEDFGDLSIGVGYNGSVTNSTRGVITINDAPNYTNALEFITIATTGNAKDFGDADPSGSAAGKGMGDYPSGISDSHGGVA